MNTKVENKKEAFNPYLPSWEYIPDGEPYVFDGRVYIYGSHDIYDGQVFCLGDYVCYSAPVDDLGNWRYEGVIYKKTQDPLNEDGHMCLYAPDVTIGPDGRYYLYYVLDKVSVVSVAVCDTPAGKYEFLGYVHYSDGTLLGDKEGDEPQFDPGVITEDGKTYLYTGFCARGDKSRSGSFVTVLSEDMLTIEQGPKLVAPGIENPEKRARKGLEDSEKEKAVIGFDDVAPAEGAKITVWNAIIPIGTLIIGALIAFYWSGYTTILDGSDQALITLMKTSPLSFNGIFEALSQSDASVALFQAALLASLVGITMGVAEGIFTIGEAFNTWVDGMKTIVITGVILLLAWSLGGVIGEVGTADYLVGVLKEAIPMFLLPTLIFILGALISFATGTSYGTMSILMPLAIPLAWAISPDMGFAVVCISGVLTGAIFGDHCSPISDTTILSSMGSGCDHIAHVNTQIYYALFVAVIAILFGYIPAGLGIPWYIDIPIAVVVMYVALRLIGEKVEFEVEEETA